MEPTAIVLLVLVGGFIWGGFLLILTTAIRREGRKSRPADDSPAGGD